MFGDRDHRKSARGRTQFPLSNRQGHLAIMASVDFRTHDPERLDDGDVRGGRPHACCHSAGTKRRVPARRVGWPVSLVWLTPSMTGTAGKSKGLTPSRQATFTA